MEENNVEDILNEEGAGLEDSGPVEDGIEEDYGMMNAYESRDRAKSIQVDRDTDEIVEHMEQIRGAIELAVEGGNLSVKVNFLAHRAVLDELKRLGYIAGHVSGEVATSIRWD